MPTIALAVETVSRGGLIATYTASGASPLLNVTDTFVVPNDGKTILHFKKSGASNCVVTIPLSGQSTVDGQAVTSRAVTVLATSGDKFVGPFPPAMYNNGSGQLSFTLDNITGLTLAIIRVDQ